MSGAVRSNSSRAGSRRSSEKRSREPPAKQQPKATNVEQKSKAGKFMAFGDVYFGKQKYLSAVER